MNLPNYVQLRENNKHIGGGVGGHIAATILQLNTLRFDDSAGSSDSLDWGLHAQREEHVNYIEHWRRFFWHTHRSSYLLDVY